MGIFGGALQEAHPNLPLEEEGRLNDRTLRETFVAAVFAHHRFRQLRAKPWHPRLLMAFHAQHKLLLLAHHEPTLRALGPLVARAGEPDQDSEALLDEYAARFFAAIRRAPTVGGRTNALQHIAGYLKRELDTPDRQRVSDLILAYRRGEVPYEVPMAFLQHFVEKHGVTYIQEQAFMSAPAAAARR